MEEMSPRATARCRQLRVIDNNKDKGIKTKKVHYTFEIYDPIAPDTVKASINVRTVHDYHRIMRSWMAKYRVPAENVTGDVIVK